MASVEMPSPGTPTSRKKTATERLGTISKRHTTQLKQLAILKKKASPERQYGPHKKRSPPGRSNSKPQAEPALHSVQSVPAGFRSTGRSLPEEEEAIDFSAVGKGEEVVKGSDKVEWNNLGAVIEEGGANLCFSVEEDVGDFRTNGDSPYGSKPAAGTFQVDEISTSAWLPQKFFARAESRWSNTSSYDGKKVLAQKGVPLRRKC